MKEKNISFERAYEELEKAAEAVNNEDTPIEKALESYKDGLKYYEYCMDILNEAKQSIEIFDRENGILKKIDG